MSLNIFYVGPFDFPNGGAAARRILGNINTLQSIGAKVTIVDGKYINQSQVINGVSTVSVQERPEPDSNILIKMIKYLSIGKNTIEYIKSQDLKPDVIFLYSGYTPYLLKLINYCRKNNIKLVFDCVEWYSPKRAFEYLYKPYYWNIELAMRFLLPKCSGLVCISKYLECYYSNKGVKTINVPPTLLISDMPKKMESEFAGKIKLVYSGSPGHKDKLKEIIKIITELHLYYELDIAGVSGENTDNIRYYGILSHEESLALVSNSHFSILLRPDNKVSKAGFSTKVVESMSCATPVITNNTGDLANFIKDGESGYIFNGYSSAELYSKLKEIANHFNKSSYIDISKNAFSIAVNSFDSGVYKHNVEEFINNL